MRNAVKQAQRSSASAGAAKQAGANVSASAGMGVSAGAGAVNELRGWGFSFGWPKNKKSARWLIMMVYFGSSYWT